MNAFSNTTTLGNNQVFSCLDGFCVKVLFETGNNII